MITRSILFIVLLLMYMLPMLVFGLTIGCLLPMRQRMAIASTTGKVITALLRVCCLITVSIEGKENLAKLASINKQGQGVLIVSNHQSPWETFYLQSICFPLKTILKKELLNIPLFGWSLRLLDPVVLDRDKKIASASQVLEQGKERLCNGNNLLVFPQGTRVPPGHKGRFSRTAAQLALAANSPIMPIAHNSGEHWPAKKPWMKAGIIHIVIGEIFEPHGADSKAITLKYSEWIAQNMQAN